MIGFVQGR